MTTLYTAQWTATAGAWETASNWTVTDPGEPAHSVPGTDDVVSIDNNGSSGYTITYNSTSTIAAIKSGTVVTLDLQSGSLIDRFGGTVDFELDVEASATLAVGEGYKLYIDKGSASGTLAGRGAIDLFGGNYTIDTNHVTVSTLEIVSGTTTIAENLSYSGDFVLDGSASRRALLNLSGHTLNLRGTATLNGVIGGFGTVNVIGSAELLNDVDIGGGQLVVFGGATVTQDGNNVTTGFPFSLLIDAGATYDVVATGTLSNTYIPNYPVVDNSGLMTVRGDSTLTLDADFTNRATATLSVAAGSTAYLASGTAELNGTLSGAGTLQIGAGENAFLYTAKLDVAEVLISGGVTNLETSLSYDGWFQFDAGELDLNSKTLTLASANNVVAGTVFHGAMDVTGTLTQFSGTLGNASGAVAIYDNGTIDQNGIVTLDGLLDIGSGGVYNLGVVEGRSILNDNIGTITNAGTLFAGGDDVIIQGNFTSTGTVSVGEDDALNFQGPFTTTLKGPITGAGTLYLNGPTVIDTTDVTVAALDCAAVMTFESDVSYGGDFLLGSSYFGGTLNIVSGKTLILSHDSENMNVLYRGDIDGGGTLRISGKATIGSLSTELSIGLNKATNLVDAGSIAQWEGSLELNGSLTVTSGSFYTINVGGAIGGSSALIFNAGEFTLDNSTAGLSTTTVSGSFTNTGKIIAERAGLVFNGEILGAGSELIENAAYLRLNGQSTTSQKVVFSSTRSAELGLGDAGQFQSSIYQFGASATEAIDLIGFDSNATKSFANVSGGLIVNISDGSQSASLHFVGSYTQGGFQLNAGAEGELLTYSS